MTRPDMQLDRNWNWKGDSASYTAKHTWVRNNYGRATRCEHCGSRKNVHWANISGEHKRDRKDWKQLCVSCHRIYDYSRGAAHTRGETHQKTKHTKTQVREIRSKYVPRKYSYGKLSAEYGVAVPTIAMIIQRKNWKHIN